MFTEPGDGDETEEQSDKVVVEAGTPPCVVVSPTTVAVEVSVVDPVDVVAVPPDPPPPPQAETTAALSKHDTHMPAARPSLLI